MASPNRFLYGFIGSNDLIKKNSMNALKGSDQPRRLRGVDYWTFFLF